MSEGVVNSVSTDGRRIYIRTSAEGFDPVLETKYYEVW